VKSRFDTDSPEGVSKSVVIALPDFAPERLLCLVQTLEAKYYRPRFVHLTIWSSAAEARRCIPLAGMVHGGEMCPHLHAEYTFNARTNERHISLLPMGGPTWGGENTDVDLPAGTLRPCRLEIEHRCFLQIFGLDYPDDALAALISGKVLVTGIIAPSGRATVVTVTPDVHDPRSQKASADPIVRTVIESIRTWRLETSSTETPFRMTFEFEVTDDLSAFSLEFQLPQRIFVRGKPSLLKYNG